MKETKYDERSTSAQYVSMDQNIADEQKHLDVEREKKVEAFTTFHNKRSAVRRTQQHDLIHTLQCKILRRVHFTRTTHVQYWSHVLHFDKKAKI